MAGKNKSAFNEHTGLRLITSPFRLIWHILSITLVVLLGGPLLLILLTSWINPQGTSLFEVLQNIKQSEIQYVGDGFLAYVSYSINTFVYWVFFKVTMIDAALFTPLTEGYLVQYRDKLILPNRESIVIFMNACQIMATRLALMLKTVPLLVGIYFLALNHGLIARSIRRADAGRESSSLYHRYKYSQIWIFTISFQLYLGMPVFVPVVVYFCVFYALCGVFFSQQMMFYKKYL